MPQIPLLVHDDRYSKHDLVIHSDLLKGIAIEDLVEIEIDNKQILQKVSYIVDNTQFQISIASHIATLCDISPRSLAKVRKVQDVDSVSCSNVEIAFRDQYIGRSDMWQLKMSLINTAIYVGKKISSLGVRGKCPFNIRPNKANLCRRI